MFCTYCGTDLPEDARFCSKCGRETRTGNPKSTTDPRLKTEIETDVDRYLDDIFDLGYRANSGEVMAADLMRATNYYLDIQKRDLEPQVAEQLLSQLRIYRDAHLFTAIGFQIWCKEPKAKHLIERDFTTYAEQGVIRLIEINMSDIGALFDDPRFPGTLSRYYPIVPPLDDMVFRFLIIGMARNGLIPVKKQHLEMIARRIGSEAIQSGLEAAEKEMPKKY